MKKNLSMITGLLATLLATGAQASDGTITFNGTITASTCTVSNASQSVQLPQVSASTLNGSGKTAGATQFAINVTGCSAGVTSANTFFESSPNVNATGGRLKNTGTAGSNVEIEILNATGTAVNLAATTGSQGIVSVPVTASAATQLFTARYYATGIAAAGTVASTVTYSMVYN